MNRTLISWGLRPDELGILGPYLVKEGGRRGFEGHRCSYIIDTGEGKPVAAREMGSREVSPPTAGTCPCKFGGPIERADR